MYLQSDNICEVFRRFFVGVFTLAAILSGQTVRDKHKSPLPHKQYNFSLSLYFPFPSLFTLLYLTLSLCNVRSVLVNLQCTHTHTPPHTHIPTHTHTYTPKHAKHIKIYIVCMQFTEYIPERPTCIQTHGFGYV